MGPASRGQKPRDGSRPLGGRLRDMRADRRRDSRALRDPATSNVSAFVASRLGGAPVREPPLGNQQAASLFDLAGYVYVPATFALITFLALLIVLVQMISMSCWRLAMGRRRA